MQEIYHEHHIIHEETWDFKFSDKKHYSKPTPTVRLGISGMNCFTGLHLRRIILDREILNQDANVCRRIFQVLIQSRLVYGHNTRTQ